MSSSAPSEQREITRSAPAPESELLADETAGQRGSKFLRVLARLEILVDNEPAAITAEKIAEDGYRRISVVAVTASLNGLDGLLAQCCWFNDTIDWYWVKITEVLNIEVRRDVRFRGGTPCLWLTTAVGEYAMATSHVSFDQQWEEMLELYHVPRCDMYPERGVRPSWWPEVWANSWPFDKSIVDQYTAMLADDPLALLANNLRLEPDRAPTAWRRLGPKGDIAVEGQPPHHLSQLTEWEMVPDAGMRKRPQKKVTGQERKDAGEGDKREDGGWDSGEGDEQGERGAKAEDGGKGGGNGTAQRGRKRMPFRPEEERPLRRRPSAGDFKRRCNPS
ncbi:hypothetical protein FRC07_006278 [Ceratobasidium sp. 392]|nr:hypothetical protein FRC07_006278 [Ceratobasidium sp. 392]